MKKIVSVFTLLFLLGISANVCFAGAFVNDAFGIKYDVGGGRYLLDGWAWCDPTGTGIAYCYYFGPTGYMLVNAVAPDGSVVDAAGRWVENGVPATNAVEPSGYELVTASYYADSSLQTPGIAPVPAPKTSGSLTSRITSWNNATSTSHTTGSQYYSEAIEFTEGGVPSITFNSGNNTSLSFDLTGDNLSDPADFLMYVYVNGAITDTLSQQFISLVPTTITFPQYANVEIRIPVINDYYNTYVRRVYILNPRFN